MRGIILKSIGKMHATTTKRKGARSIKEVPQEILELLNIGKIETANLVESLAIDQRLLLTNILEQNERVNYLAPILTKIEQLKKQTMNTINEAIGAELLELVTQHNDKDFVNIISHHTSDVVRGWATYIIGKNHNLSIAETLEQIQRFAADKHFGVRETCWLAVRSKIATNLIESIEILSKWTIHLDENIRRFTTEATRPRGVWCEHIKQLKQQPELAISILEPLKSDPAKYVQNSVANWLNDASKTSLDFVIELCRRWERESNTEETKYIVKKALRTLSK